MLLKVCVVSRLQALSSLVRITVGTRDTSLMQNVQTASEAHSASYSVSTGFFLGRKVTGS